MFFAPFPEEEILDSIAHRSLMRVNTVLQYKVEFPYIMKRHPIRMSDT